MIKASPLLPFSDYHLAKAMVKMQEICYTFPYLFESQNATLSPCLDVIAFALKDREKSLAVQF